MKKILILITCLVMTLCLLCGCDRYGPLPPPTSQTINEIVKIELIEVSDEKALYDKDGHDSYILYTLESNEISGFVEKFSVLNFREHILDHNNSIGNLAVWIYYKDGNSDIVGVITTRYLDADYNIMDRRMYYLENPSDYYDLFAQYVDSKNMPTE